MKSFNEKIQELELIRSLLHERIKNGLSKKVGKFYDELIADIQARILKDKNITRNLSKTISDLKEALETPDLRAAFFAIAKDEVDFLHKNYNDLAGFSMFSNVLKPKQIETLLATTLVQGATIKAWNYGLQADQAKRLERDLKIGISLGETNALLAQRIAASLGKSKREATTLAVTGAGAIVSEVRQKFFEANDDVIKYYQYQATLDTRTSELCRAYDGLLWDTEYKPVDHKLPFRMPRVNTHFNCRSTIIPITKSWEELGVEGMEGIDVGTRASMNGYVPKNMNFNDWLKTQSPETIEKTLGKGRAELFLQGKITMRDLITQQGRAVNLDELISKKPPKIPFTKENVSDDEKKAILKWSGTSYTTMRACMKGKIKRTSLPGEFVKIIDDFVGIFDKYESNIEKGTPLFRGICFNAMDKYKESLFSKLQVGDVFFDDAVSSFSKEEKVAVKFAKIGKFRKIILKLKARGNELCIGEFSKFKEEQEVVVKGGEKFKVVDIKKEKIGVKEATVFYLE